jgi:glutaminyl-tRNA synthetase
MAVLYPLKVALVNVTSNTKILQVPDYPFAPERGSHEVSMTRIIFIDRSDFKIEADSDFYGLTKHQPVALKYSGLFLKFESMETNEFG